MPGSLKNKLLQFEAVPPAGAWEKIAMQLDGEFAASDATLATKLENAVIAPPAGMFDKIEAGLHERNLPRVVPIYRRLAVAAAIMGILLLGAVYFLNDRGKTGEQVLVKNSVLFAPPVQDSSSALIAEGLPIPSRKGMEVSETSQVKTLLRRGEGVKSQTQLAGLTDLDIDDPKPVQMIAAVEPVQVSAPPIRDAKGNVIMDLSVISHPNEPYITVTSPNGSQTNISKKFLSCLSYLNGNFTASEMNYEGQQWKSRFAEWRNKLTETGFVPGANNFFDIFELQELIRD